jgi:DNA-binding GntR family transcriptional regulator
MSVDTSPEISQPVTLREKAYVGFTRSLLVCEIKPGQFVTQRELVEITGLPLGAIRELVPRLEAEGLIRTVPHRGMQVLAVDLNLVRNAFQFRTFLEHAAVGLFAGNASDELVAALRKAHESIIARAEAGDGSRALVDEAEDTDRNLHETIIDHLGNDIVSNAFRVNWIKIRLIRQSETRLFDRMVLPVMHEHMKVIEAIERRDAAAAAQAMVDHIETARRRAVNL